MLHARKASIWKNSYAIAADGRPLATWDASLWKAGGHFDLDGERYEVRANLWGNKYGMVTGDGTRVASANRVGRKHWTVEAGDQTYGFQRASIWRYEERLLVAGQAVGSVKRRSIWRSDAVADLPLLPVPVQVFVLAVVLDMWDWSDASAGAAAVSS